MSTDESIFSFLTQPENLTVALEVADHVEQLKRQMHQSYLVLSSTLAWMSKSNNRNMPRLWSYLPHPARAYRKDWAKSSIAPILINNQPVPQLVIVLGQSTLQSAYRLFWGVSWNMTPPKGFLSSWFNYLQ